MSVGEKVKHNCVLLCLTLKYRNAKLLLLYSIYEHVKGVKDRLRDVDTRHSLNFAPKCDGSRQWSMMYIYCEYIYTIEYRIHKNKTDEKQKRFNKYQVLVYGKTSNIHNHQAR